VDESFAIDAHLTYRPPGNDGHWWSGFAAVLRDARRATGRALDSGAKLAGQEHDSWLGALGYMVLLDQVGKCFKPKDQPVDDSQVSFCKALAHFTSLQKREIKAVYALRCAFAHDYSVYNRNTRDPELNHYFNIVSGPDQPVIALPLTAWDGSARAGEMATRANLEKVGDIAEEVSSSLSTLHKAAALELILPGGALELLSRYSLFRRPRFEVQNSPSTDGNEQGR
jgi:hypothetical protein